MSIDAVLIVADAAHEQGQRPLDVDDFSSGADTVTRGTSTGTISLPEGARLHGVLVVPSDGGRVTVTIPGQPADQCPIDFPYSEDFGGKIIGAGDIVLAGNVAYYRITWDAA